MQKKSGFTIIELLIVVIIIGVLATIAVPQFGKAVEKTKLGKAKNVLGLVYKSAMIFKQDVDGGNGVLNPGGTALVIGLANEYVELGGYVGTTAAHSAAKGPLTTTSTNMVDKQADWTYTISAAAGDTLTVTAARISGTYGIGNGACQMTINEDQEIEIGAAGGASGTCVK